MKITSNQIKGKVLKNLIIYELVQNFTKIAKHKNKSRIVTLWKNIFFKNRLKYRYKIDSLKIYGRLSKIK